jgi:two-component system, chemotaxis family, chemotaxis protein CheY
MPDINGLELIGYVKSNPTYRDIPLIIVSTEKSDADKKRGMALGAAGYVVKPFTKEDLMAMVTKVLGGK